MKTNKRIIIITAIIAVVAAIGVSVAIFSANRTANDPARLLSLGEKYLLEMDYEQALVQFLEVIEIEPNNIRAYLGAAEAYVGLGQTDDAINILRLGLERTDDEAINSKLDELMESGNSVGNTENSVTENIGNSEFTDAADINNADINDTAGANLTGKAPVTLSELRDNGIGVPLQELVGRYGIEQGEIELFPQSINDNIDEQDRYGFGGHDICQVVTNSEMIVRQLDIDEKFGNNQFDELLRFKFGMTLVEALEAYAINNPDIFAVAEDPSYESFVAHGGKTSSSGVIQITDERIISDDGMVQQVNIKNYEKSEYSASRNSNGINDVEIYINLYYSGMNIYANADFNAEGKLTFARIEDVSKIFSSSATPSVSESPPVTTDTIELISCGSRPSEDGSETIYMVEVRYSLVTAETAEIELMMNAPLAGDTALTDSPEERVEIKKGSGSISVIHTFSWPPDGIVYNDVWYPAPTKGMLFMTIDGVERVEQVYLDVDFGNGTDAPVSNDAEDVPDENQ